MVDNDLRTKRSRFDQTEPEPRRPSRFDRRSRSPSSRPSESTRERTPLSREPLSPSAEDKNDPAAAAAAAAAKINAQFQARQRIHSETTPARVTANPTANAASPGAQLAHNINGEIYESNGDYIKDIEVNDLRNRYLLTKGATQQMIKDETGADVTTRGSYLPDKSMATASNPPLYLHVTATSREALEQAVEKIEELMKQELPKLVDERRFRRRDPPEPVERDEYGRRKWPDERIPINLEPIPGFNLRAQVVGQGGAYVKHIQQETGCRVQIKGRGSGFIDNATGRESDEPMYLHVAGPDPKEVQHAKELCEDLIGNVKEQYERFKEQPPPQRGYGGGGQHGGRYEHRDRRQYGLGYSGGGGGFGGHSSPQTPSSAASPPQQQQGPAPASTSTDYNAQYAQYYGGADPYAAYGGYQNYVAYYQYYQQYTQQQQQQQSQQSQLQPPPPPPQSAAPPPPPPPPVNEAAPPPPPSSASPPTPSPGGYSGGYNAVPPPPGL